MVHGPEDRALWMIALLLESSGKAPCWFTESSERAAGGQFTAAPVRSHCTFMKGCNCNAIYTYMKGAMCNSETSKCSCCCCCCLKTCTQNKKNSSWLAQMRNFAISGSVYYDSIIWAAAVCPRGFQLTALLAWGLSSGDQSPRVDGGSPATTHSPQERVH